MPFSDEEGKDWLDGHYAALVGAGEVRSVLDVGAGAGTYSARWRKGAPRVWWTGVEVHRPYVTEYRLHEKYDALVLADILRALDAGMVGRHDLVILGDVLEHLEFEAAVLVWRLLRRRARWLMVSLPIVPSPQGAWGGNEHERHRTTWTHAAVLSELEGITAHRAGQVIGVYLAEGT